MKSKSIIPGNIVLGGPLYCDGEFIGIVTEFYKPINEDHYKICKTNLNKWLVIDKKNIYISNNVEEIFTSTQEDYDLWAGNEGLIGAGDINDGENVYFRIGEKDVKYRINIELISYEIYKNDNIGGKDELKYCMYKLNDNYFLPIYFNNMDKVYCLYLNEISLNNLSLF